MNNQFYAYLILPLFLLTGCGAQHPASQAADENAEEDFFIANNQTEPTEENATHIRGLTEGLTYLSTHNKCIDNLNMLRDEKSARYPQYAEEYQKITDAFSFLNANKNIMDQSARRIYTMELKMKIETLCSKIQYSNFVLVHEKQKALSGI